MITATELLSAAALSLLLGVILAPFVSRLVLAVGVVDKPDGRRKLHGRVVPLAGGPLVILTIFLSLAAWYVLDDRFKPTDQAFAALKSGEVPVPESVLSKLTPLKNKQFTRDDFVKEMNELLNADQEQFQSIIVNKVDDTFAGSVATLGVSVPGFLIALVFLFGVGLIDDRFHLSDQVKLLGQIVAISIAIVSGVHFESITLFGFDIRFGGSFGCVLTMIWLLGVVNAVNLLDGIDGMVGSIGLIAAATLAVMAYLVGHSVEAGVAACLAGTLAAFLVFNKPPAKILLGDSGSMSIGLLLGSLAVVCCLKGPATLMLGPPLTLLLLPLLNLVAAITRRVLTGRSIYSTDRDHLHHRLLQSGLSHKTALILVGVLSSILSLGVLASLRFHNDSLALTAAIVVVAFLVLSRLFGVQELGLVRNKLLEFFSSLTFLRTQDDAGAIRLLDCAQDWRASWQHLVTLLHKAAEVGNPLAMYNLGMCYLCGEGVAKDQAEAVRWFRWAAERGLVEARTMLQSLGKE